MSLSQHVDRARARYAAALYRTALLRDPHPGRAGQAVVAAFTRLDWDTVLIDDQLEARLVAALPPRSKLQWSRPRTFAPLTTGFWKLLPRTRVALGLRALRGMATPSIAQAVNLPVPATQALLLDGLLQLGKIDPITDPECQRCVLAHLEDTPGARGHLLTCTDCRTTIPQVERTYAELAQQLGHAVGGLSLPHALDEALTAALDQERHLGAVSVWRRPLVWQVAMVSLVLLGVGLLFWPHGWQPSSSVPTTSNHLALPKTIIEDARQQYATVPAGTGILHRHWTISLDRPQLTLEADEWVDLQQPGRHRMQLVTEKTTREWQVGDGDGELRYVSNIASLFCGIGGAPGFTPRTSEQDSWQIDAQEQAAMRLARWNHGPWAIGLHYLDQAATADHLRSLGIVGEGTDAALTISAEGRTIDGTLLLRFDPVTHGLREVRQLRPNNGQTEERVPWRLVSSEKTGVSQALQTGVLSSYPDGNQPALVARTLPIIDPACPSVNPEQTQSLPRLLATQTEGAGPIWGLPGLPAGIDRAVLVGSTDAAKASTQSQGRPFGFSPLRIVYTGPNKRLVLAPVGQQFTAQQPPQSGPWQIYFYLSSMPSILRATLQHSSTAQLNRGFAQRTGIRVQAEGWTKEELLPLLASVRPLRLDDWAQAPESFYEAVPLDAALRDRLLKIARATAPQADRITPRPPDGEQTSLQALSDQRGALQVGKPAAH